MQGVRTWGLATLVVVLMLVLPACGGHDLNGTITIIGSFTTSSSNGCYGTGGYADISAGAAVTVSDESGKILGTSQLEAGKTSGQASCVFAFKVTGLPDANFYRVEVSHRGQVVYSKSDLDKSGWKVDLSLGS
jgi:hypothetical protein